MPEEVQAEKDVQTERHRMLLHAIFSNRSKGGRSDTERQVTKHRERQARRKREQRKKQREARRSAQR